MRQRNRIGYQPVWTFGENGSWAVTLAVGIVSGGLDSLLAVRLVMRMGIDVLALHFVTGFESIHLRRLLENPDALLEASGAIHRTGAKVLVEDLRQPFLGILANPSHGYGSNLNPCIDCKILMLRTAKRKMEELGASFVFTGEVLGQRPMSQRRDTLQVIARECGLGDRLVRPLCGKLLSPTTPETEGLFQRDQLEDISGRSRIRQRALAQQLGVADYPTPAGGCLLTDPAYSARARDLLERRQQRLLRQHDAMLLLIGRHVVLPEGGLAIIGRNQPENCVLDRFAGMGVVLAAKDFPGPTTLVEGQPTALDLESAARLTARYGKARSETTVAIRCTSRDGVETCLNVLPQSPAACRIL